MISTPDAPGGLFEKIESEENCLYKRIKMDYTYGIGKIYTKQEIDIQRVSPSFEREYCLKYLGKIGNVFSPLMIDKAVKLGEKFKGLPVNHMVIHGCGVDPGFGSSKSAIVLTERLAEEDKIRVLYAEEFEHPNPNKIASLCFDLHTKYENTWFFVDGANRDHALAKTNRLNE